MDKERYARLESAIRDACGYEKPYCVIRDDPKGRWTKKTEFKGKKIGLAEVLRAINAIDDHYCIKAKDHREPNLSEFVRTGRYFSGYDVPASVRTVLLEERNIGIYWDLENDDPSLQSDWTKEWLADVILGNQLG